MKSSNVKYCKALVNIMVAFAILLLTVLLVPKLFVFFSPFVAGWLIAMIASPLVRFFEEKVKIKRKAGSAVVIIVVIGLVVLGIYVIGARIIEEAIGFVRELPAILQGLEEVLANVGENLGAIYAKLPQNFQESINSIGAQMSIFVGELFSKMGSPTIEAVGNIAKQLPSAIIAVIMCLLSSYFFVADRNVIGSWFRQHVPVSIQRRYEMLRNSLKKAVGGYFKAQLKIEVWMYFLLVIGLSILRVEYVLLIALGIALLDFLPFFGTGTVMVPWAILSILSGEYKMAIGLLIIWGVGQLARQVIQPKIVGDSIGVAPIPTLFLLYIGFKTGGVIGMIIAVPLGLIVYTMYEEGVFDTTRNSIFIIVEGLNRFRKLKKEDLEMIQSDNKETNQE